MDYSMDHAVRLVEDLKGIASLERLSAFMGETLAPLGLRYFALFELGMEGADIRGINNYPPAWVQRYRKRRYEYLDPVIVKMMHTKKPFRWDSLEPEGYLERRRNRNVLCEGGEFGLREGFTFPILGSGGYIAAVSFAADRLDDDRRLPLALQLASLHLHERYGTLRGMDRQGPVPDLTRRERECLTWAGAGKTDWEIAGILSISEASARTYLERAKQKLGVTTKTHAVAKAVRHHLIRV